MTSKMKTGLLIGLVGVNIAVLGLTSVSTIYMLRHGIAGQAADGSSVTDESSTDNEGIVDLENGGDDALEASSEDGVVIGEQYTIRSTKAISDAYKSGDTSALSKSEQETLEMASELLDEIIKPSMDDYAKEKAVYEWMTKNLSFDEGMMLVISTAGREVDSPHGVLRNHVGVCVGFATTFRMLMQMMDIDCKVVHDVHLSHSWDLVKIGDGWYHVDIYSDLHAGNYLNFNMSDAMCSMNHEWDRALVPEAASLEYNPAYRDRVRVTDVYALPKELRKAVEGNGGMVCYVFDAELTEMDMQVAKSYIEVIVNASGDEYVMPYGQYAIPQESGFTVDEKTGEQMFVVRYYKYDEGQDTVQLDDDAAKRAEEAINDAMSDLIGDSAYYFYN